MKTTHSSKLHNIQMARIKLLLMLKKYKVN